MDHRIDIQGQKVPQKAELKEEDEALSLSDFPIAMTTCESHDNIRRSSSSETTDFFEFFSDDPSRDMSNAEDIIFRGKLMPFKEQPQTHTTTVGIGDGRQSFQCRRRSESMSELKSTCSDGMTRIMQSSRSLDYRKLRRVPSSAVSEINRNSSVKSSGSNSQKGSRPRWYVFMLGLAKFPVEMELKDIKSRQVRRQTSPATMFPPPLSIDGGGGGSYAVKHSNERKRSWDLLRVLSCKGPSSVGVVSTGLGMIPMPQACHAPYS